MPQVVEYSVSINNIHIIDSYKYPKRDFGEILDDIRRENPNNLVMKNRSNCSMSLEWATHNFLYNIGYQRERTCDVDLDYPQKWYYRIGYAVFGVFAWLFID